MPNKSTESTDGCGELRLFHCYTGTYHGHGILYSVTF